MDEEIDFEFPIWNLWLKKGTPLDELRNKWSYDDVEKANALLNMESDYAAGFEALMAPKEG